MPSHFADGGSLENTGVAALLAYSDIDKVIACINPQTRMQPGAYGVADGQGGFIPGTALIVDACIPPLFGYQPYEAGGLGRNEGYVLYSQGSSYKYPMYAKNQVFESMAFPALLQGLWAASGSGSYARPAIFSQRLAVQPNTWFGVTSAHEITVVWFYLTFVTDWAALFAGNQPVQAIIELERSTNAFPNYSTLNTNLSATQINLLANLTAWGMNEAERATGVFSSLFNAASSLLVPAEDPAARSRSHFSPRCETAGRSQLTDAVGMLGSAFERSFNVTARCHLSRPQVGAWPTAEFRNKGQRSRSRPRPTQARRHQTAPWRAWLRF